MYISITLSAYINVSTAFGEKHNGLRDSRLSLVRPSGSLRLVADKTTKKQEDHRSENRAYRDLIFFLALHSQRSAHSNADLADSLITADTTSLDRSASKEVTRVT